MNKKILIVLMSMLFLTVSCKKKIVEESAVPATEVIVEEDDYDVGEIGESDDSADFSDKRWKDVDVHYTYHFTGKIDNQYAFDMYLKVFENEVTGYYYYLNNGSFIDIKGTVNNGALEFKEEFGNVFRGNFNYDKGEVIGEWTNVNTGAVMPFSMANPKGKGYPKKQYKVFTNVTEYSSEAFNVTEIAEINSDQEVLRIDIESVFWVRGQENKFHLYLQDYNFDGYLDIMAFHFLPAYPPAKFQFLLYNPVSKEYDFDSLYNDSIYTASPGVDFRKRLIYEYGEGKGGTLSVYKYNDNKLYKIYDQYIGWVLEDDSVGSPGSYYKWQDGREVAISGNEFNQIYGKNALKFFESKYCYEL